jgi:hypothetical protein
MNSTRGSTPPNPNFDLPNRSTELNKTLGIIGTPHEESISMILSTKLAKSRGIEEILPITPLTLEHRKPQNRAPLLTDLGGERLLEVLQGPHKFPQQIPKSKVPKTTQENHQERAPKITTKNNQEQHIQTLRNHTESSIHSTNVHTRSSLPPNHPTLSTRSHH